MGLTGNKGPKSSSCFYSSFVELVIFFHLYEGPKHLTWVTRLAWQELHQLRYCISPNYNL